MNNLCKIKSPQNLSMGLISKLSKKYRELLESIRKSKPLKIVNIIELSTVPGETLFAIQFANKHCVLTLSAATLISSHYNLNDFNDFHAQMIRHAATGSLVNFLKLSAERKHKITNKYFDKLYQKHIFTIERNDGQLLQRAVNDIVKDKPLLESLNVYDIYDLGYTEGCESILKEQSELSTLKRENALSK